VTESRTSICDHQSEINNSHGGLTPNRSPVQWNPGERYSVSYPCVGFWIFDCRFLTESRTSIFDHQSEINNSHGGLTSNRSPIQPVQLIWAAFIHVRGFSCPRRICLSLTGSIATVSKSINRNSVSTQVSTRTRLRVKPLFQDQKKEQHSRVHLHSSVLLS
jgi:hypothetical protein